MELWKKMYEAAKKAMRFREVSSYISCGQVAAAILSENDNIYTGICVDTACSLGICAERNAIFNMLTNKENKIKRVLTIMSNGKCVMPCGSCRELMCQLMPEDYGNILIMADYEKKEAISLSSLTPKWWI